MLKGHVDILNLYHIIGWAYDDSNVGSPPDVTIFVNSKQIAHVVPTLFRKDLHDKYHGDGRYGFSYTFMPPLRADEDHEVRVCVGVTKVLLSPGVLRISNTDRSQALTPAKAEIRFQGCRRYIIHVGPPKTGTKYLQSSLTAMAPTLLRHSIFYPIKWWQSEEWFGHHELSRSLRTCNDDKRLSTIFAEINEQNAQIVILSS